MSSMNNVLYVETFSGKYKPFWRPEAHMGWCNSTVGLFIGWGWSGCVGARQVIVKMKKRGKITFLTLSLILPRVPRTFDMVHSVDQRALDQYQCSNRLIGWGISDWKRVLLYHFLALHRACKSPPVHTTMRCQLWCPHGGDMNMNMINMYNE